MIYNNSVISLSKTPHRIIDNNLLSLTPHGLTGSYFGSLGHSKFFRHVIFLEQTIIIDVLVDKCRATTVVQYESNEGISQLWPMVCIYFTSPVKVMTLLKIKISDQCKKSITTKRKRFLCVLLGLRRPSDPSLLSI